MSRLLMFGFVLLTVFGCAYQFGRSSGAEELTEVSLIAIVADPDRYHGRRVWVVGVVRFEFEGNGLFVDRDSYRLRIAKNALWISPNSEVLDADLDELARMNGRFVLADGRVDSTCQGHFGAYSACLVDVAQIRTLP